MNRGRDPGLSSGLREVLNCPFCADPCRRSIGKPLLPHFQLLPTRRLLFGETLLRDRELVQCLNCGLRYFDLVPSSSMIRELFSFDVERTSATPTAREAALGRKLKPILPQLLPRGRVSVMDIGCASGSFLGSLPAQWQKSGCDINSGAASAAAKHLPGSDIRVGRLQDASFKNCSFDLITAWDVVEHMNDLGAFLGLSFDLLRPDGFLIFETGNYASAYAQACGLAWYYYSLVEHSVFLSTRAARAMLVGLGFGSVSVTPSQHDPPERAPGLRTRLLAMAVAALTLRGRLRDPYLGVARLLGKAGSLPQPCVEDHLLAVAQKVSVL